MEASARRTRSAGSAVVLGIAPLVLVVPFVGLSFAVGVRTPGFRSGPPSTASMQPPLGGSERPANPGSHTPGTQEHVAPRPSLAASADVQTIEVNLPCP